jgi:hypothetical protein
MAEKFAEDAISDLKEQVYKAAELITEYRKREKLWVEKRSYIEKRLTALVKRIEEFSGGR